MRNSKKLLSIALVLIMTAVCFSACGSNNKEAGGDGGSGGSTRDSMVIGMAGEPNTLDPQMNTNIGCLCVERGIFKSLIQRDFETDTLSPGVAESWEISEDGLTFDMTIRTDFVFHNGDPVTMDDVIFTLERSKIPLSRIFSGILLTALRLWMTRIFVLI